MTRSPVSRRRPPGKAVAKDRRSELEASIPKRWTRFQRVTVQEAYEIGTDLNELKSLVPRGEWLPWLGEHFAVQSAQRLMKLARKNVSYTQIAGATNVTEALALLAAPAPEADAEPEADVELDDADVVEEDGEAWTWAYVKACDRAELIQITRDNELDIDTDKARDKEQYKLAKLRYDVARLLDVDVPREDRPKRKSNSDGGDGGEKIDYKKARVVKRPGKRQDEPEPERQRTDTSSPYGDADAYEDDYDDEADSEPEPSSVRDHPDGRDSKADTEDDLWAWYEPTIEYLSSTDGARRTFSFVKVNERDLVKHLREEFGFSKQDAEARIGQLRFDGVLLDDGATLYRRVS
jgi:hypothetical protein